MVTQMVLTQERRELKLLSGDHSWQMHVRQMRLHRLLLTVGHKLILKEQGKLLLCPKQLLLILVAMYGQVLLELSQLPILIRKQQFNAWLLLMLCTKFVAILKSHLFSLKLVISVIKRITFDITFLLQRKHYPMSVFMYCTAHWLPSRTKSCHITVKRKILFFSS